MPHRVTSPHNDRTPHTSLHHTLTRGHVLPGRLRVGTTRSDAGAGWLLVRCRNGHADTSGYGICGGGARLAEGHASVALRSSTKLCSTGSAAASVHRRSILAGVGGVTRVGTVASKAAREAETTTGAAREDAGALRFGSGFAVGGRTAIAAPTPASARTRRATAGANSSKFSRKN